MPKKHISPKIDAVCEQATRSFSRHFALVVPGKKGVFFPKFSFLDISFLLDMNVTYISTDLVIITEWIRDSLRIPNESING